MRREDWDRRYASPHLLWSSAPNRLFVAEVEGLPAGRALDLACGEGRNAVWLAERGWQVTGVDFSEIAIGKARALAAGAGVAVELVCADLLAYEPQPAAYDLVAVLYLQLPADERRLVLARAAEALAPGGTFLLVGHDVTNIVDGVGGPSDTRVLYAPEDIVADLPGLEVVRAERRLREVEGEDRPAIDALVRARRPAPGG